LFYDAEAEPASGIVTIREYYHLLDKGVQRVGYNRIRFIDKEHLARLLIKAGLAAVAWYGDWAGSDFSPTSKEIIVATRRANQKTEKLGTLARARGASASVRACRVGYDHACYRSHLWNLLRLWRKLLVMNQAVVKMMFVSATAIGTVQCGVAQHNAKAHVKSTDSETLWTGQFANCDYGFYVLLPPGVVGHSNLPPNPIHGFAIALPESETLQQVNRAAKGPLGEREYDTSDAQTLKESISTYISLVADGEHGRTVKETGATRLGTLPATRVKVEYDGPSGKLIEEEIIAVRGSTRLECARLSTITLKTRGNLND
jgi:hypothetical protein